MTDKNRIQSTWTADPLIMKPTTLGLYPRAYNFFGYLPDLGTTYGMYECSMSKDHSGVVTNRAQGEIHCPECGNLAKHAETPVDDKVITNLQSLKNDFNIVPKCSRCNELLLTSINYIDYPFINIYCTSCGNDITDEVNKFKDIFINNNSMRRKDVLMKNGTTYSVLSLDSVPNKVEASNVEMRLYDKDGKNPFWNVEINAAPVGRIYLQDQANNEEIKDTFVSEFYAKNLAKAMSKVGVKPLLKQVNARVWKAQVSERKYHKQIRAEVTENLEKEYNSKKEDLNKKAENLKEELLERLGLVLAGMDKNFYSSSIGNPLKESLLKSMQRRGYNRATAISIVESAFRDGAIPFFTAAIDKAVAYLDHSNKALAEIGEAVKEADIIPVETIEERENAPEEDYYVEDNDQNDYPIDDESYEEYPQDEVYETAPVDNMPVAEDYPVAEDSSFDGKETMSRHMAKANVRFTSTGTRPSRDSYARRKSAIKRDLNLGM